MWQLVLVSTGLFLTEVGVVAADVTARVDLNSNGTEIADSLGIEEMEFQGLLQQELETIFDTYRPQEFLRSFSDTFAFANRGIGVDYAVGSNRFEIGVSGNIVFGFNSEEFGDQNAELPPLSTVPNASLMVSWNLGEIGLPQLTVFGNGFRYSHTFDESSGSLLSSGAHVQAKLFRSRRKKNRTFGSWEWGGLDVTSGIEFSRLHLSLREDFSTSVPLRARMRTLVVGVTPRGELDVTSTSFAVPIELTSSIFGWSFLSLYGGMGVDFQFGDSRLDARLESDLVGEDPRNQEMVVLGTGAIDVQESAGPSVGRVRFLSGFQVKIAALKFFAQANLIPTEAVGLSTGIRIVL